MADATKRPVIPVVLIRITCDRCGKDRMFAETHFAQRDVLPRDIIRRARRDRCGGRAGKVELMRHRGSDQPAGAEERADGLKLP